MAAQLQRQRPPLVLEVANDVHNGDDPQLAHAQPGQDEPVSTPNVLQDVSSNSQSGRSGEVANNTHHINSSRAANEPSQSGLSTTSSMSPRPSSIKPPQLPSAAHCMAAPPCPKRTKTTTFHGVEDVVQTYYEQWRIMLDVWTSEGDQNTIDVAKRLLLCSRALHIIFVGGDDANDPDPIVRLTARVRILPAHPANIYFLEKAVAVLKCRCTALEAHLEGALAQNDAASEDEQSRLVKDEQSCLVEKIMSALTHMARRKTEAEVALRRAREKLDRGERL